MGVKITRDRSRRFLSLSQEAYLKKVYERFGMQDYKPIDTPVEKNASLSINMSPKTEEENEKIARVPCKCNWELDVRYDV